ncbi:hypothetical protein ABIF79_002328 [Bradyrhizobium japonicum]
MSDQARSTVGQRQIGRAGQKRANLDLDRPGKQVPRAGTNDIGQWIINRGRLTESKNIGSLGHGVSLSSRGSGRLVTRLDTPPSSHRHHPDSAIARVGMSRIRSVEYCNGVAFIGRWQQGGGIMLASGLFGVLAGLVILTGLPMTGLWVLGLLLGIDLLSHGIGWLTFAWRPVAATA